MNLKAKCFSLFLGVALFTAPMFGLTVYSQAVSAASGVTIPESTHGINCQAIGVTVYNNATPAVKQSLSAYLWTVNASTFDVSVTFNASPFTGTVYLAGCFVPTTASTDFQVTRSTTPFHMLNVCDVCTSTAYAARSYSGSGYIGLSRAQVSTNGDGQSGTVWSWVDTVNMHVVFGVSTASGGIVSSTGTVVNGVSGYPGSNYVPLGHVAFDNTGAFGSVTDDRPVSFQ